MNRVCGDPYGDFSDFEINLADIDEYYRIYCLGRQLDGNTFAVVITPLSQTIQFIFPRHNHLQELSEELNDLMENCALSIQILLQDFDYESSLYPYQIECVESSSESSTYIFAAFFCLSMECPILIRNDDLANIRDLLAYWICTERLPDNR